ncbi:unnamed protein product [Urochloa decumbens]|uniref:Rx N-terminal domain-containing protein n=1 Tax=Urochloa decumbens TaxID=240449 RepID=A0ABC9B9H3_9POAL
MGVMKPVLSKLATLMGDEYKKIKGLRKKMTFLQRELRDMDALLEKMDSAGELDPQAKNWRKDIIEMSYNIEDCIDDFMQCIGQADNKAGILRKAFKYLRSFKNLHHLANQFEAIKAQVMEASERRKRYFIVVDDLWDSKAWVTIQYAFQQNNQCSRVMITTRNGDLARSCCGNHKCIHNMRHLSVEDSKKLFFCRIFGSQDACPSELKEASSEILKRVQLVRRWVAEGFVSNSVGQDVWDVADSYFNELVNRSMIQPTYDDINIRVPIVSGCRVHDMLLDLIVTRCKEDNFLSLVNDPQAVLVEVQDKAIIRRLNVVGSRGREDDKVAVTTAVNLAHIRSLSILEGSNWIPSLHEFKFVRVLSLAFYHGTNKAIDLTVINQLSQLRYIKIVGDGNNIMLPCQIRGLQFLETLDLSGIDNCSTTLEIDDAPRTLSHLIMPDNSRLPDWIGRTKSLRTLSRFSLPKDSLEGIIGLGELTALSDLNLVPPKWCAGLSSATWMAALSTSLDKLGNLKQLKFRSEDLVFWCGNALSSLSPPFRNIELLHLIYGCTFSRGPGLGAKQVLQEDVDVIGTRLPSLLHLGLRIPGILTERIVIGGSTGFLTLKMFHFDCDGMSFLTFEAGAMPVLQDLYFKLDANGRDKAAPAGLHHLPSLEGMTICRVFSSNWRGKKNRRDQEADDALFRSVFQEAADAIPTRPELMTHLRQSI